MASGLCASIVLIVGYGFDIDTVVRLHEALPAMVPETAVALLLASIATFIASRAARTPEVAIIAACATALVAIVAIYSIQPAAFVGLRDGDAMSPATGLIITATSAALFLGLGTNRAALLGSAIANTLSVAVTMTVLMTYVFGATTDLADTYGVSEMAVHTALGFLAVNIGLVLVNSEDGVGRWIFSGSYGSLVLKIAMVLSLAALAGLFLVIHNATQTGWMSEGFRYSAMCAIVLLIVISAFAVAGNLLESLAERQRLWSAMRETDAALAHRHDLHDEQEERNRVTGQIVAGVAHDFNNAFAAIRTNLELIEIDPANKSTYANEALTAVDRAAGLTRQLLASGKRAWTIRPVQDAAATVRRVIDRMSGTLPEAPEIALDIVEADFSGIAIDEATLERCLLNLIDNARDASDTDDAIRISMSRKLVTNGFAASFDVNSGVKPGPHLLIEVSDRGRGMTSDVLKQATQPYFTTKGSALASGLGLSAVNGACQQHGGGVLISSKPGRGTTVTMALPLDRPGAENEPASAGLSDAAPDPRVDILILAATTQTRSTLELEALNRGHSVRVVSSVSKLMECLDTESLPNVVLVGDTVIEGMAGQDLVAEIRLRFPTVSTAFAGNPRAMGFNSEGPTHRETDKKGVIDINRPKST